MIKIKSLVCILTLTILTACGGGGGGGGTNSGNGGPNTGGNGGGNNTVTIPNIALRSLSKTSAGYQHSCAVVTGGEVVCWGNGADGRLGNDGLPVPIIRSKWWMVTVAPHP